MSQTTHPNDAPRFEPDQFSTTGVSRFIWAIAIFVLLSLAGVGWWLDEEVARVTGTPATTEE